MPAPTSERLEFIARYDATKTELDAKYPQGHLVVVSLANPRTGSTADARAEVPVSAAARLIANDDARIATDEEVTSFRG